MISPHWIRKSKGESKEKKFFCGTHGVILTPALNLKILMHWYLQKIITVHNSRYTVGLGMQDFTSRMDLPQKIYLDRFTFWVLYEILLGLILPSYSHKNLDVAVLVDKVSDRGQITLSIDEDVLEKHAIMTRHYDFYFWKL